GARERIAGGDRYADLVVAEMAIQPVEFVRTSDRIVGAHAECPPLPRNGLDAVRMDDASSRSDEVETAFEFFAAGECQHRVESTGRNLPKLLDRFRTSRIDHVMSAERVQQTRRR